MIDFFGPILWLVVALGVLITFHEFGHFWVARRCGVRVLRFSVGFGPALWSRTGTSGTEFRLAAIPLGGYVKMLDSREGPVPESQRNEEFNAKPLGQRMAIVAAGPIFNLIFAVAAFWLMFVIGIPESRPVIGEPAGIAAEAGIEQQDLILEVDGREVQTWTRALLALMGPAMDRKPVRLVVERPQGERREIDLPLDRLDSGFDEENPLESIGITPWRPDLPPVIGEVGEGTPAAGAGLRGGDRILSIGGQPVSGWRDVAQLIPDLGVSDDGQAVALVFELERDGRQVETRITPAIEDGKPLVGIQSAPPGDAAREELERAFTVLRHGPVNALGEGIEETWRLTTATFGILGRMITGKASLSNLSGPITIAQMAHSSALLGVSRFLFFLGLISLSLAIINLLPIPILDGGHLMYQIVEMIKGSPVSEQTQIAGQYVGLLMVASVMGLAIFNDILRLFS